MKQVSETMNPISVLFGIVCFAMITGCDYMPLGDSSKGVSSPDLTMTVYKSASCGCCKEWVTYMAEEGFSVTAIDREDMDDVKASLGIVKNELKSCHTAVIGDYLVEGHVPANDVLRLLTEQPQDVKGLTAPGMPLMSPGMASREPKDYAVLSFSEEGETEVYSQY